MPATIQGLLKSATGTVLQTQVEFESLSTPSVGVGYVVSATKKRISSNADGEFTIQLEAGDYYARWFNGDVLSTVRIAVPDDVLTHDFETLISGDLVYTHTANPSYAQSAPPNGSYRIKDGQHIQLYNSTTGLWHTMLCLGSAGALQIGFAAGEV